MKNNNSMSINFAVFCVFFVMVMIILSLTPVDRIDAMTRFFDHVLPKLPITQILKNK